MTITPYIMFGGTCEEALNFYAKVLNGGIESLMRYNDAQMGGSGKDNGQKVMHAHFRAANIFFMAADNIQAPAATPTTGMLHLSFNFESEDQINHVFEALSEGATVSMPLQDTFWGARFGMLTDKFGVNWMFNYDKPKA
jgi:PhnB protein